ncbi:kinase-like protein [Neolentinus lepideus HHB14362 ss-1]|uniref:non-specific serine/threonine protein kinase n=1 Tax=Neolentinus lepideus HHB14362 ss-1 TaxID=1314782 RepID=A0A165MU53_9AGAM|nr:kinase-like protein [Neolentinus lepideus HHB14362 ss-1]
MGSEQRRRRLSSRSKERFHSELKSCQRLPDINEIMVENGVGAFLLDMSRSRVSTGDIIFANKQGAPVRRFKLGRRIGGSSSSSVYCALDLATGETVASRIISLTGLDDNEKISLLRKAETLLQLSHSCVATYEGIGYHAGFLCIFFEYAENGSLSDIQNAFGALPERILAIYLNRILEGLKYLHQNGLVHGNLEANTVLATKDGSVKLSNAGLLNDINLRRTGRAIVSSDIHSVASLAIQLLRDSDNNGIHGSTDRYDSGSDSCNEIPNCSALLQDFLQKCFTAPDSVHSITSLLDHPWLNRNAPETVEVLSLITHGFQLMFRLLSLGYVVHP